MTTRMLRNGCQVLTLVMALALPGVFGCSKHEKSKDGEPGHGDHAMMDSGKAADQHGRHDDGQTESMLMVRTEPTEVQVGQPVKLKLMIHDATGAIVKDFD